MEGYVWILLTKSLDNIGKCVARLSVRGRDRQAAAMTTRMLGSDR